MRAERVLVSACLLGLRCRHDALPLDPLRLPEGLCPVPLCPEQLGGLPTPRPPAQMVGGDGVAVLEGRARVVDQRGEDVTEAFLRGAEEAVKVARLLGIRRAFLKEKSPSCGVKYTHRDGELAEGMGVTAAALRGAGVQVMSEEELR